MFLKCAHGFIGKFACSSCESALFQQAAKPLLLVQRLGLGHEFRPGFVPVAKNPELLTLVLFQEQAVFILKELAGMRPVSLLPHSEMEHTGRKDSVKEWCQQVRDAEKDYVVLNVQRGAGPAG